MRALLVVLAACEVADTAPRKEPSPRPTPVSAPAAAPPQVRPPEIEPIDDMRATTAPPVPTPVAPGLPASPITDRTVYDPPAYDAWLAKLTPAQRAQVAAICRKEPVAFRPECDGIGPLHIPVPPQPKVQMNPPAFTAFASAEQWDFVLTTAQRKYIDVHCPGDSQRPSSDLCGQNTPLVVAFDDQAVAFDAGARFAFAPGVPVATDWPTAVTPWLALDRDGDGVITSGAELFGDRTRLPDGSRALHGFAALAPLDANGDGVIDAADPAFAQLLLWGDDLRPASTMLVSISLAYQRDVRCDGRGNCEGERAAIRWRDARGVHDGAIVDVYLPVRRPTSRARRRCRRPRR